MFSPQDQVRRRAGAWRLTRNHLRALPGRLRRCAAVALCAMALLLPLQFLGAAGAGAATFTPHASVTFTPLKLINGWTDRPYGTSHAAVANISGIVHLKGAIATNGTNPVAFILPAAFRPATSVFVSVDMCAATNGELIIQPTGVVKVEPETSFSDAQCFTSLDGVSFARSASLFTPLTLVNGWTNAPAFTSNAAVRKISGIVQFKGAIATSGSNPVAFTLPPGFRPAASVYVKVGLCVATNGRLFIQPSGVVIVEPEGFPTATQCFTSLDGASFAP